MFASHPFSDRARKVQRFPHIFRLVGLYRRIIARHTLDYDPSAPRQKTPKLAPVVTADSAEIAVDPAGLTPIAVQQAALFLVGEVVHKVYPSACHILKTFDLSILTAYL